MLLYHYVLSVPLAGTTACRGPESFSMPRPCWFATRSGRKGHSQWPTFLLLPLLALCFHPPTCEARKNSTSPTAGCEAEMGGAGSGPEGRRGQCRGEGEGGSVHKGRLAIPSPSSSVWCQGLCRLRATFPTTFIELPFVVQSNGCLVGITW